MLREWNGNSLKLIRELIGRFYTHYPDEFRLYKYEALSPDSFIWVFDMKDERYCLYAEDFVQSLSWVREIMRKYGSLEEEDTKYKLIAVKKPKKFTDASPVKTAEVYNPPNNTKQFMKYAADSGHDFVFLGKSLK